MGIASGGPIVSTNQNSAAASWTTGAIGNAVSAGKLGFVATAHDNQDAFDVASQADALTDSVGNTWLRGRSWEYAAGAANGGATITLWWSVLDFALATGSTFTLTLSTTRTAKAMVGWWYSLDAGYDYILFDGWAADKSDAAADAGSQSIAGLASLERLYMRATGTESTSTTWTPTAGFTSGGVAASAGAMGSRIEFKIATSTGETSDPTSVVADQASVFVAVRQTKRALQCTPKIMTNGASATNTLVYTTLPWTPTPGRACRYVAMIFTQASSGTASVPTCSGNGLTWVQEKTQLDSSGVIRFTVFSAIGIATAGATTFTSPSNTPTHGMWYVHEMENGGAVVQAVGTQTRTCTLGTFGSAKNCALVYNLHYDNTSPSGQAPDTGSFGWQFAGQSLLFESPTWLNVQCYWRPDNANLTWTKQTAATANEITVGIEIEYKPAAYDVGTPSAEAIGGAFGYGVGDPEGPVTSEFRGAYSDPARTPADRLAPFGKRALVAYGVMTSTSGAFADLVAPYSGLPIYDLPLDSPPALDCGPLDTTWYMAGYDVVDVTNCGIGDDGDIVGTPCVEAIVPAPTSATVENCGIGDDGDVVGTPCVEAIPPISNCGIDDDGDIVGTPCVEAVAGEHPPAVTILYPLPYNDPSVHIARTAHLGCRVTDPDGDPGLGGGLRRVVPVMIFPERPDLGKLVIHDGDNFDSRFAGSSRVEVSGGYDYDLIWYTGRWPSRPKLLPFAYDLTGNEAP